MQIRQYDHSKTIPKRVRLNHQKCDTRRHWWGDHTSLSTIPASAHGKAKLLVKDAGIIAGVEFAKKVFNHVDAGLEVTTFIQDGACKTRRYCIVCLGKIPVDPSSEESF